MAKKCQEKANNEHFCVWKIVLSGEMWKENFDLKKQRKNEKENSKYTTTNSKLKIIIYSTIRRFDAIQTKMLLRLLSLIEQNGISKQISC